MTKQDQINLNVSERFQEIEEKIFNNTGFSYAEVVEYYPDAQTIRVKLLPDGLITTDIPIGTPFSGHGVGQIQPFFEGQQVLVGFVGSINNSVLLRTFYTRTEKPPTTEGSREKYGKLVGKILDPLKDFLLTTKQNILLMNDVKGLMFNSSSFINLVSPKPISTMSNHINQIGDLNINLPTNIEEIVEQIDQKFDDLNNKLAQVTSLADANKQQTEKLGKLTQLLTWAVKIIGLSPFKVINIYNLYPALSGNPFMKFFKSSMTDMKAIQLFNLDSLTSGLTSKVKSIGEKIKSQGLKGVKNEISKITSTINIGGDVSEYLNYLDFDVESVIKGDIKDYGPLIIQNLPQFKDTKNKAKKTVNKMTNYIKKALYYYEIVKKQYDRITNSAYFKRDKTDGLVGDFGVKSVTPSENTMSC